MFHADFMCMKICGLGLQSKYLFENHNVLKISLKDKPLPKTTTKSTNYEQKQNHARFSCTLPEDVSSFAFTGLTSIGKKPPPWVETHFDPTVVHDRRWHCSKCMPHDMFTDCDVSPLCPTHSYSNFTVFK